MGEGDGENICADLVSRQLICTGGGGNGWGSQIGGASIIANDIDAQRVRNVTAADSGAVILRVVVDG